jgi:hypothetical protein
VGKFYGKKRVKMAIDTRVQPYVTAMQGASGLSEFDAITSVLYAIVTHIDLEEYPILCYLGVAGSGKSEAMKQLFPMCRGSKLIQGTTLPSHRDALVSVRTAFVEEADNLTPDLIRLYTKRYMRQTATEDIKAPIAGRKWESKSLDIFGATVMHRRVPLNDLGLRSRAITIRTTYRPGSYKRTTTQDLSGLADSIASNVKRGITGTVIDRVQQTWNSIHVVSQELGMKDWGRHAIDVMVREAEILAGGQGFEPGEAILQTIDILSRDSSVRQDKSIHISDVVRTIKDEFALILKPMQVKEEAESRGFSTGMLHGYPVIKVKKELLDKLLPEEG